ncbi:complex I subunit 5 family protein [Pseudomonas aeruginosa]|uniref:complex I subunit 5 family protein n=1 Tax=Pseudomonas aeruginosa TaxID=287 RepID=UPI001F2F77BA|nr:proton-conducting transporter membrane subunit [Pseudomonas aeruginosa]
MSGGSWLVAAVALPLAAAVAALLAGRRGAAAAGVFGGLLCTAVVLGLAAAVLAGGVQRVVVGGWPAPLGIELRADGLATAMLLMTAVVGFGISLYAWSYFAAPHGDAQDPGHGTGAGTPAGDHAWLFWPAWLMAWGALNALYLSGDLFNLYVTLELLGLAAVALVALAGAGAAAAALRYLLLALLGSMLYILGVELLYAAHQTLDLQQPRARVQPSLSVGLAAALMTTGLLVKTAVFPLHFWLPPAHGSAPAPVSAALSALVVKAGFYLLARLWLDLFGTLPWQAVPVLLGVLGCAAVLWGGVQALRQQRLKPMIAYSTVAQLGYLLIALPLAGNVAAGAADGALTAAVLLAASHAAAKASMFLCAGSLLAAYGHDRIDALAGFGARLPLTAAAFALAAVSLVGLPPTGGFVGKYLLVESALRAGAWGTVAVVLAGTLLAAMFLFHALSRAFIEEPEAPRAPVAAPSAPAAPQLVSLALALLAVGLAVAGGPLQELLAIGAAP